MDERSRWRFVLFAGAAFLAFAAAFNLWLRGDFCGGSIAGVVCLLMIDGAADATRGR